MTAPVDGGTPNEDGVNTPDPKDDVTPVTVTASEFKAIGSQEELDRIISERLTREKRKYADYDDLKTKAEKLKELEDAQKTETQRLQEQFAQTQQKLADYERKELIRSVADEKGLSAKLAKRLSGSTREELEADADELLADLPTPTAKPPSEKPTPKDEDTRKSKKPEDVFDVDAIVKSIKR